VVDKWQFLVDDEGNTLDAACNGEWVSDIKKDRDRLQSTVERQTAAYIELVSRKADLAQAKKTLVGMPHEQTQATVIPEQDKRYFQGLSEAPWPRASEFAEMKECNQQQYQSIKSLQDDNARQAQRLDNQGKTIAGLRQQVRKLEATIGDQTNDAMAAKKRNRDLADELIDAKAELGKLKAEREADLRGDVSEVLRTAARWLAATEGDK
jgi:hypothetical protein